MTDKTIFAGRFAAIQGTSPHEPYSIVFYANKEDIGRDEKALGALAFKNWLALLTFIRLQAQLVETINEALQKKFSGNRTRH